MYEIVLSKFIGGENMETVKIYLSGGMSSLSLEKQTKWRKQIIDAIKYGDYDYEKKPHFFNPVDYYNFQEVKYNTQREVMEFDLNALRKSDLVIVNFNDPESLGTCVELAIAYEMKIPIIGLIEIPKINLAANIVEGTTEEILNSYVGHFSETVCINGNVGLAAHNRGYPVNYFARIKELTENNK